MPKRDSEDKTKALLLLVTFALVIGLATVMVYFFFSPRDIVTSRWFTVLAATGFVIGCLVRIWKAVWKAAREVDKRKADREADKQKFGRYSDPDRYWSDDVP